MLKHIKTENNYKGVITYKGKEFPFNNEIELLHYRVQIAENNLKGCKLEFINFPDIIDIDNKGNLEQSLPFVNEVFELFCKLRELRI